MHVCSYVRTYVCTYVDMCNSRWLAGICTTIYPLCICIYTRTYERTRIACRTAGCSGDEMWESVAVNIRSSCPITVEEKIRHTSYQLITVRVYVYVRTFTFEPAYVCTYVQRQLVVHRQPYVRNPSKRCTNVSTYRFTYIRTYVLVRTYSRDCTRPYVQVCLQKYSDHEQPPFAAAGDRLRC